MLKIEKASNKKDIQVRIRKKEPLFSRFFLYAFSIAFFIHFLAIVLFHVSPFAIINEKILPPSVVEIDTGPSYEKENILVGQLDNDRGLSYLMWAPPSSTPQIPALPSGLLTRQLEYIKEDSLYDPVFSKMEREIEESYFIASQKQETFVPIKLNFSGALSSKESLSFTLGKDNDRYLDPQAVSSDLTFCKLEYMVQVENKTGKIFWYQEMLPEEGEDKYKAIAEKILREIKFIPDNKGFVTKGEIEILFTMDKGKEIIL